MALAVITNPLGWSHALLMLLPPAAVLWRDARTRWLVVTVLVVFTFPRQSLTAWAGPTPVAPGPGLWLGAHAVAALALFAALCAPARPPLAGSHA